MMCNLFLYAGADLSLWYLGARSSIILVRQ